MLDVDNFKSYNDSFGHPAGLALAERIRFEVAAADWPRRQVTVSIGVATLSRAGSNAQAVLSYADAALYEAKHGGRNRVEGARPRRARGAPSRHGSVTAEGTH